MPFKPAKTVTSINTALRKRLLKRYQTLNFKLLATRSGDAKKRFRESVLDKSPHNSWADYVAAETCNIAAIFGDTPYCDIDLDAHISRQMAPHILPPTACFGREDALPSHYIYEVGTDHLYLKFLAKKAQDTTDSNSYYVEWRQMGGYTVIPPSVHSNGDELKWQKNNVEPVIVDATYLKQRVALLATACKLVDCWGPGGWHEGALHIGGALARMNVPLEDAELLITTVGSHMGMKDIEQKLKNIEASYDKHAHGENVTGWNSLREVIEPQHVYHMKLWIGRAYGAGTGDDELLNFANEFNESHAYAVVGGTSRVIIENPDDGSYVIEAIETMHTTYRNQRIAVTNFTSGDKAKVRLVNPIDYWMEWEDRRSFVKGIKLAPPGAKPVSSDHYNPWRGWSAAPAKGSAKLLTDHYLRVMCDGDKNYCKYVLDWLAAMIQEPGKRPDTSLTFIGEEGCGKNMAFLPFELLLGHYFGYYVDREHLFGRFADPTTHILVLCDELSWEGGFRMRDKLYSYITQPKMRIEIKNVANQIDSPNFTWWVFLSNKNKWVVPATRRARRFNVLKCSDRYVGDKDYFTRLFKFIDEEQGAEKFLHHLQSRKYNMNQLRERLETEELIRQREYEMDAKDKFVLNCINDRRIGRKEWTDGMHVTVDELYGQFLEHNETVKTYGKGGVTKHEFGRYFSQLFNIKSKSKRLARPNGETYVTRAYLLPAIADAAKMFYEKTGVKV